MTLSILTNAPMGLPRKLTGERLTVDRLGLKWEPKGVT